MDSEKKEKDKKKKKPADKQAEETKETPSSGEEKKEPCEAKEEREEMVSKKEYEQVKENLLRVAAEFDNYKKRTAKEKDSIYQDSVADTVKALLPALDAMDSAAAMLTPEQAEQEKGFLSVFTLITDALQKLGVETVAEEGVPFDPNIHNAVMMEEGNGEHKVAQIFQKGYRYKDKMIRAAMVKVKAE